jgi:hypothetical protein
MLNNKLLEKEIDNSNVYFIRHSMEGENEKLKNDKMNH